MSFWYGEAPAEKPTSVATGQAPLSEIWEAGRGQLRMVENTDSSYQALYRAYDERIKAIHERTGETRENPLYLAGRDGAIEAPRPKVSRGNLTYAGGSSRSAVPSQVAAFDDWLGQVAQRHPDAMDVIKPDVPLQRDAEALARHTDERLAKAMASRDGIAKWGAVLGGGIAGSLYDPLQVLTLFAGGGAGGARTVIGRIAKTALSEAVVNGATEAALQTVVQDWRKQAGLPNGFQEAMQNVGFAALAGGVLGGGVRGIGEAASKIFKGPIREDVIRSLTEAPQVDPKIKAAVAGDAGQAVEALRPIRQAMPAEVRGALDHADILAHDVATRPAAASSSYHDLTIDRATRAAQSNEPFVFDVDREQISRIVERLAPTQAQGPASKGEQTLRQFLMSVGGVRDYKGELEALGLSKVSERFVGKLVKENGLPLDEARRAAAEAGFFNNLYGTADAAMEKSTVRDLLDALDTAGNEQNLRARTADGDRAYVENLVSDIAARAGPAVDDDLIVRAVELANAEQLDPAEALDRVLIDNDRAIEEARSSAAGTNESPPGAREFRGGLDDPGAPDDDGLLTMADFEGIPDDYDIPFFDDGRTLTPAELMAELDHHENLFQLVEACRA